MKNGAMCILAPLRLSALHPAHHRYPLTLPFPSCPATRMSNTGAVESLKNRGRLVAREQRNNTIISRETSLIAESADR